MDTSDKPLSALHEALTEAVHTEISWCHRAAHDLLDQLVELHEHLACLYVGVAACKGMTRDSPILAEALKSIGPTPADDTVDEFWAAISRHATKTVEADFASINAQALVTLWTLMEDGMRSLVFDWLTHDPTCWERDDILKISVTIGETRTYSVQQWAHYVIDHFERTRALPMKAGPGRLEGLLQIVGFNGEIDPPVRLALHELAQIRHVIVHRRARSDAKLLTECPSLATRFPDGQEIQLTFTDLSGYFDAAQAYASSLVDRFGPRMAEITKIVAAHMIQHPPNRVEPA